MPGSVSKEDGWRRYESKFLDILVDGVDLSALDLRFSVMRQAGDTPIITKTSPTEITTTGVGDDIARVEFEDDDYDDLPADVYYGVLWSDTDDLQLWPQPQHTGDLYLGHGLAPV